MVRLKLIWVLAAISFFSVSSYAQSVDSLTDKAIALPGKLLSRLQGRTASLDRQLTR